MCDTKVEDYLLDTNAYFAILRYVISQERNEKYERILNGNCCISKLTRIEIISVIGKYARGAGRSVQICDRVPEGEIKPCGKKYVVREKRKWSQKKLRDWIKLENEIVNGRNPKIMVTVLEINDHVITEAQKLIEQAFLPNFGSMDAMMLGTAKAHSTEEKKMIVVTADKGFKAGMDRIGFPHISI